VPSNFNVLEAVLDWFKSHSGIATKHDLKESEHKIMSVLSVVYYGFASGLKTVARGMRGTCHLTDVRGLGVKKQPKITQSSAVSFGQALVSPAKKPQRVKSRQCQPKLNSISPESLTPSIQLAIFLGVWKGLWPKWCKALLELPEVQHLLARLPHT